MNLLPPYAFEGCSSLTSIALTSTVHSIGIGAFDNSGITGLSTGVYDVGSLSGECYVYNNASVTLVGTGAGVQVTCGDDVTITLDNSVIDNSLHDNMTPLEFIDITPRFAADTGRHINTNRRI